MSSTQQINPVAVAYAKSMLELASERQSAEAVGQELSGLREVLEQDRSFGLFLRDPAVGADERQAVLDRAIGDRVGGLVKSLVGLLGQKGHLTLLPAIADAYDAALDELHGKVEVDVIVAQRLGAEELETVRRRVSAALKKDAVLHQYVDESIIGGLVLRLGDQLIDASVRAQLEAMRKQMKAARPAI